MIQLKVKITKQDIANGKAADCHKCPLALAINRALREVGILTLSPRIWPYWSYLETADEWAKFRAENNPALQVWIAQFDRFKRGKELEFTMDFVEI